MGFVVGLCWGSFLEVVASRLKITGKGFSLDLGGYSRCPRCKHRLYWKDLIPLFSFLWLRGKCRYCLKPIGWETFGIELLGGITLALLVWRFDVSLSLLLNVVLFSLLLVIFFYDLKKMIIPDPLVWGLMVLWLIMCIGASWFWIRDSLLGGALLLSFFGFLHFISRGKWFGLGDAKLGGVLGLFLGWKMALILLWLSFVLGGAGAIALLALGIKNRKSLIPFAPFMIVAFVCLYLFPQVQDFFSTFL